jgi:hypothetical protein
MKLSAYTMLLQTVYNLHCQTAIATAIIIGHGVQHLGISARNARLYFIMRAARPQIRKFDPSDAIAVITGHRKQGAPMERELALLAFITWMLFPNRPDFVSSAKIVGAANYYLNLGPAQRSKLVRDNPHFSQDTFARTLLGFPLGDTFSLEFENAYNEAVNISEIIDFFMICPAELRPSLLKALHLSSKEALSRTMWTSRNEISIKDRPRR